MGLKAKLKFEDGGILTASVFYAAVGVVCFVVLAITDLGLIHIGLLGVISLATAYGLFRRRSWALWSVFAVAIMVTVFATSMLYFIMGSDVLIDMAMVAYLISTWIFTVYVAAKRKKLEF
ncbi:MAG: hypothetical protein ACPL1Z_02225 [Candidatus Bathyarchaeales archaeon]|nr:MAG: hypothetical protein C0199_00240 [Candidatus Bathyarchaeota archaeon]